MRISIGAKAGSSGFKCHEAATAAGMLQLEKPRLVGNPFIKMQK